MLGDRDLGGSGRVVLARKVSRGVSSDAGDAENLLARKVSIGGVSRGVSRGVRGVSGDAGEGANPVESIGVEGHPGESVVHQTVQILRVLRSSRASQEPSGIGPSSIVVTFGASWRRGVR
jgi:hypothetical protein